MMAVHKRRLVDFGLLSSPFLMSYIVLLYTNFFDPASPIRRLIFEK